MGLDLINENSDGTIEGMTFSVRRQEELKREGLSLVLLRS